jgi:hypothetical protein
MFGVECRFGFVDCDTFLGCPLLFVFGPVSD